MPIFDKLMASEICDENAMKHPLFKGPFANYFRWCNHNNEAPKFRVYLAMIGVRFRFDRVEGMAVNSTLLLQVKLVDYTVPAVAKFVYRIEHILAEWEADEVPPTHLM